MEWKDKGAPALAQAGGIVRAFLKWYCCSRFCGAFRMRVVFCQVLVVSTLSAACGAFRVRGRWDYVLLSRAQGGDKNKNLDGSEDKG